jgi:hypothetical protein
MVELKTIELLLQLPNLLPVCRYAVIAVVWLTHYLLDDQLRVTTDIKPLNPKLDDNAQAVDKRLVFRHIVGCVEMQSNHVK